jgi:GDP-mannose 6-dehydrogenase
MKISIFGLGYVGSVSLGCFAQMGHQVLGVDIQEHKVQAIGAGQCPVSEPSLPEIIAEEVAAGRIRTTGDPVEAVQDSEVSFVCVGTPVTGDGLPDLSYLESVCRQIGRGLAAKEGRHLVVIRSTIMPGACTEVVIPSLEQASGKKCGPDFGVASNPEFLREGSAVADFFDPPMIVLGCEEPGDGALLAACYETIQAPVISCGRDEAMMVKTASNIFHALKITFANEIGSICSSRGLDSHQVMGIFCRDQKLNISARYLKPGFAFGGSCLPKDVSAFISLAKQASLSLPVIESIIASNHYQIERALKAVQAAGKKKIALLGLSFKENTDDLRGSPAVELAERLIGKGYDLKIHDNDVKVSQVFGTNLSEIQRRLPHLSSLMSEDFEHVLGHGELIVICKKLDKYRQVPGRLAPGQKVLDLVRMFSPGELPPAQHLNICG